MHSYGFSTDVFFLDPDCIIKATPLGEVVRSPSNPTYYGGNFIWLNNNPPHIEKLESFFRNEFYHERVAKHFHFRGLNEETIDLSTWQAKGYSIEKEAVLSLKNGISIGSNSLGDFVIRALTSEDDWEHWMELDRENGPSDQEISAYKAYTFPRIKRWIELEKKEMGSTYGLFIDNDLVSAAGLYHQGGVGRFQQVMTRSSYRKKGFAKTLMTHIIEQHEATNRLITVADMDYHAIDLYTALGFEPIEYQWSALRIR